MDHAHNTHALYCKLIDAALLYRPDPPATGKIIGLDDGKGQANTSANWAVMEGTVLSYDSEMPGCDHILL